MILGVLLLLAGTRTILDNPRGNGGSNPGTIVTLLFGSVVGLLSGITGSGGGFILIPVMLFAYDTTATEVASVASGFVVLNSLGGLAGHASRGHVSLELGLPLLAIVGVGGLLGAQLGSRILRPRTVRILMAFVLLAGGVKLLLPFLT